MNITFDQLLQSIPGEWSCVGTSGNGETLWKNGSEFSFGLLGEKVSLFYKGVQCQSGNAEKIASFISAIQGLGFSPSPSASDIDRPPRAITIHVVDADGNSHSVKMDRDGDLMTLHPTATMEYVFTHTFMSLAGIMGVEVLPQEGDSHE